MKHLYPLLYVCCCLLLGTACSRPNKVLPKKEGLWKISEVREQVFESSGLVIDTTFQHAFTETYFFKEDGSGVFTDDGFTVDFNWTYDKTDKVIELAFLAPALVQRYQVEKSRRTSQTWLIDFSDPPGSPDRTERTIMLERIE